MTKLLCKFAVAVAAVACAWSTHAVGLAQSKAEPAIVISLSPLNNQLDDISYLTDAAGFAGAGNMARVQIDGFTQGIDKNKPMCIHLFINEEQPEPDVLAFIPVTNFDDVLNIVSQMALVEDEDDYSVISTGGGPDMYVKEVKNHAVIAQSTEMFDLANVDLSSGLGDLPSRYNVAVRIYAQRIPESMREQMLNMIEDSYREQIENFGDDELASELQTKNFELQMAQIRSFVEDTDQIVLGLDFDKEGKNIHLDVEMIGLSGSKLVSRVAAMKPSTASRFAGFLMNGAAFTANSNSSLNAEDIDQYVSSLDDLVSAAKQKIEEESEMSTSELAMVNDLVDELFGLLKNTVRQGNVDLGAVLIMDDNETNLAAGVATSSPAAFEAKVKATIAQIKGQLDGQVEVKLDCENYQGVRFHEFVVPVPAGEEELGNLFGDKIKIYAGFGNDVVYLAAGSDPMKTLKAAMAQTSGGDAVGVIMQYNVFLAPVLKKVGVIQGEMQMEEVAEILRATGRDRMQMSAKVLDNGMKFRFEIQDGFLKAIGAFAGPMMGMGAPGMDF